MPFRQIVVDASKDAGIVVDLWPGMFVKPSYEKEPTKANPEVKADLGVVGGKLSPLKIYYPENFDIDRVVRAADSIDNPESLFSKMDHCPMCERKRREIIERLRQAIQKGSTQEEKMKLFVDEGEKIKKELGIKSPPAKSAEVFVKKDVAHPEETTVGYKLTEDHDVAKERAIVITNPAEVSPEVKSQVESVEKDIGNIAMNIDKIVNALLSTPEQVELPF